MHSPSFDLFFTGEARQHLLRSITDALQEDGPDLTTNAVFTPEAALTATIVAKEDTLLAGLPLIPLVLEQTAAIEPGRWHAELHVKEAARLAKGTVIATITGSARVILRAERIVLNFISHMSGIANLVNSYVVALRGTEQSGEQNTGVRLLDTRKTLPGLRYPEKYAVLVGGGCNHRKNLAELLMLKDNHIDAAGGITAAVARLREVYVPTPPIEVECRTLDEVREAVVCKVQRIMLDNMEPGVMAQALGIIPQSIEVEISGGVTLESIATLAASGSTRKADFISVGRLTHSAPAADFSMRISL